MAAAILAGLGAWLALRDHWPGSRSRAPSPARATRTARALRPPEFVIRPECGGECGVEHGGERAAISRLHEAAFGRPDEARLVERLRESAQPYVSLLALLDGEPVGHVAFSPVVVDGRSERPTLGLAPLAVAPHRQGRGVGSALVVAGLEACEKLGCVGVFVLGSPAFYSRFAFRSAAGRGFYYVGPGNVENFQLVELVPDGLAGCSGRVVYHPAFEGV
jgi:putative acetyltransferase